MNIQAANTAEEIQHTMQIQEISRKSKVLQTPWISLEILESSRFSGQSLQKEKLPP